MDQLAATFIVRLAARGSGDWSAVVERVQTGEKYRVGDLDAIGPLIERIVSGQESGPFDVGEKKDS